MPSFSRIMAMKKEDCRTTWEKLYRSMIARGVKRLRPEDIDWHIRRTTGLDFQEGTTISRVVDKLKKNKYVTIDDETGELILSDPKEALEDY